MTGSLKQLINESDIIIKLVSHNLYIRIKKIVNFKKNALSCFGYSGRGIAPGTFFGKACAEALLSEDLSMLPIPTLKHYREPLTREKTAFFEMAAMANNSVKSLKM